MDLFKVKRFIKAHKPNPERDMEDKPVPPPEEMKIENSDDMTKSAKLEPSNENEEEEDDDFIINEVKRRLKQLRRNSFMVLIPEESCPEEEEEEETSSSEWRSSEVEDHQPFCGFDEMYDIYCERMLFFDRMSSQHFLEAGYPMPLTPSPRSASKKLALTLRSLSLRKREESQDDDELVQQQQQRNDPYQELETAYVAHICLTWEAIHCQYMQLSQKISSEPENATCYSHAVQRFQQFLVLLQRFIENEPFEQGLRVENFARARKSFPGLLQVPSIGGSENEVEESDLPILVSDLIRVIEDSILTFHLFLKMDKKRSGIILSLFGGQNQNASPLQQTQSSLEKKKMKVKELIKKKKGWKKKSWPRTMEEVELLFGLIDIKIITRVLRMARISKEQLLWCEEKLSKLDLSGNKLKRDASPILFPG